MDKKDLLISLSEQELLAKQIAIFLEFQLTWVKKKAGNTSVPSNFVKAFKIICPQISKKILLKISNPHANAIAICQLGAVNNFQNIFYHRYLHGEKIVKIASILSYSDRQLSRLINRLPLEMADNLILLNFNEQMKKRIYPHYPGRQLFVAELSNIYNLSQKQADVFYTFIENRNHEIGREKIAFDHRMGKEALRDKITKIIRQVGATSMKEAVQIAVERLNLKNDIESVVLLD